LNILETKMLINEFDDETR